MNGKGERLTPVYRVSAETTDFELNSGVALSFEDAVVKDGMLSVSVSPSDKDTYYYVDVLQTDEWSTSEEIMHEWQSYLDAQIFMYTGAVLNFLPIPVCRFRDNAHRLG